MADGVEVTPEKLDEVRDAMEKVARKFDMLHAKMKGLSASYKGVEGSDEPGRNVALGEHGFYNSVSNGEVLLSNAIIRVRNRAVMASNAGVELTGMEHQNENDQSV
ncbi:hypothetical protein [Nocardia sp. NPDC052566]|uniref:hypothetical protein n=1 Tax=Nocardia sp. NPDC052566 TaxID=3364330 RepID=UPI0037C5ABC3